MNCQVSAQYGKDEFKQLYFYCNFCGEEMDTEEIRECTAEPELCKCGNQLGNDDYAVSVCLKCEVSLTP